MAMTDAKGVPELEEIFDEEDKEALRNIRDRGGPFAEHAERILEGLG